MKMILLLCLLSPIFLNSELLIQKKEFLFTKGPFGTCHASTIAEVAPNQFIVAYFAGNREGARNVAIWISTLENGTWSWPRKIAEEKGKPCWNPVLFQVPNGELMLFYKVGKSPRSWHGVLKRSYDQGKTWSEAEILPANIAGPTKNKPLLLPGNTLLCGSSHEGTDQGNLWYCQMNITKDFGKSWISSDPIYYPEDEKRRESISVRHPALGIIQPTLFVDNNNTLHMLCRSKKEIGYICHTTSQDNGMTWNTVEKTSLRSPSSGIDCVRLDNGHIVLVYNPTKRHRNKLGIAVSEDEGKTWNEKAVILEDRFIGEFSYPAIIQASDGSIHITYTYNRKRIRHIIITPKE